MKSGYIDTLNLNNIESPFTELFSLLKRYDNPEAVCPVDQLSAIHHHADNAIDVLLHGLQDVGQLMGLASCNSEEIPKELKTIGFFISAITNLTEALKMLRADTDYLIKESR